MSRHPIVWVFLVAVIALGLLLAFFRWPAGPPAGNAPGDPRRAYKGPYRNVDPDVHYVADDRCGDCHAEKARSFAEHPMGRSLMPVARAAAPPEDSLHHNPFDALGSQFLVEREGTRVRHRRRRLDPAGRPAAELKWDIHYAIGSGAKGYSYLTERDGYLFQTPISWFAQKQMWDLSPGFGQPLLPGRAIMPDCLFCHANRTNHVAGSVNRYANPVFDGHAIGCQRCHGPGELHVASRGTEKDTIVNPRHLEPALRDAVCEQCHLEGESRLVRHGRGLDDFRPGLPMELFWSVFIPAAEKGEGAKAVGHVEQMYQSACFRAGSGPVTPTPPPTGASGEGRLGCISCHDPHQRVEPEHRVEHYRAACLECHKKGEGTSPTRQRGEDRIPSLARRACSLPVAQRLRLSAQDSCIDCHMPRVATSDIVHTASTDHRIPRDGKVGRFSKPAYGAGDGFPVVSFYRDRKRTGAGEDERDLALALVKMALNGQASAVRALPRALPMLGAALQRDPDDWAAGEARGYALALQSHPAEALAAFEAVLAGVPERELALMGAASMAEALRQTDAALSYWRRAVAVNPWVPDFRRGLALLLVKKEAWDEAQLECRAWLRLDPFSAEARGTRILCLLGAGNKEEARAEFARIEALSPTNLAELRARFSKKLK